MTPRDMCDGDEQRHGHEDVERDEAGLPRWVPGVRDTDESHVVAARHVQPMRCSTQGWCAFVREARLAACRASLIVANCLFRCS